MTDERHSRDERIFWADAFCAMMYGDPELRSVNAAAFADEALDAYRERFGIRPGEADGNCSESPNSSTAKLDFSGEPEPITEDVLRSLGMREDKHRGDWLDPSRGGPRTLLYKYEGVYRFCVDLTDARKLRAIMEIIRA